MSVLLLAMLVREISGIGVPDTLCRYYRYTGFLA